MENAHDILIKMLEDKLEDIKKYQNLGLPIENDRYANFGMINLSARLGIVDGDESGRLMKKYFMIE